MRITRALTFIALLTLLATGAQAQASSDLLSEAELAMIEELAFEPFCPNQKSDAKVCVGEKLCFNGGSDWQYPTYDDAGEPTCPDDGYEVKTIDSVDKACEAAEDAAGDPADCPNPQDPADECAPYCKQGTVTPTPSKTSRCCTVTNTKTCMLVTPSKEEHIPRGH